MSVDAGVYEYDGTFPSMQNAVQYSDRPEKQAQIDAYTAAGVGALMAIGGELLLAAKPVKQLIGKAKGAIQNILRSGDEATTVVDNVVKPNYSQISEPRNAGPGKDFTKAQKAKILEVNKEANGGLMKSDKSGKVLDLPTQSQKGVPANMNQAEVDHIVPKAKGGSNANANAQVLSKEENLLKGSN